MKLRELIRVVNSVYPDDLIIQWHDDPDGMTGDTLAQFIEIEIRETFEEDKSTVEQLTEALRVMDNAERELNAVRTELFATRSRWIAKKAGRG